MHDILISESNFMGSGSHLLRTGVCGKFNQCRNLPLQRAPLSSRGTKTFLFHVFLTWLKSLCAESLQNIVCVRLTGGGVAKLLLWWGLATCPTADSCENSSAIFPTLHFILFLCRRQSADSRALKWAPAAQRRRMKRWSDHLIWFLFKLISPYPSLTLLCLSPSSSPVGRGFGACLIIHQLSSGLHEGLDLNKTV